MIDKTEALIPFSKCSSVLDVGCGTGALCAVLDQRGYAATGTDLSENMLRQARKKAGGHIPFIQADVLEGLPFADESFDAVLCSFLAHGMGREGRIALYRELCRAAKYLVIVHDYNSRRSLLREGIELLEGGDYFNFIREAEREMQEDFCDVQVVPVGRHSSWYLCIKQACRDEFSQE